MTCSRIVLKLPTQNRDSRSAAGLDAPVELRRLEPTFNPGIVQVRIAEYPINRIEKLLI
jgi:hypothetical protein